MALTYSTAVETARMTATRDALGGGALEILTAADELIVSIPLTAQGGTIAGDVWTLAFTGPASATGAGTAAKAQIKTSADAVGVSGLTAGMTGSGADVIMQNTSVEPGQEITVTSATVTHTDYT